MLSECVKLDHTPDGRRFIAGRHIRRGELLLRESPVLTCALPLGVAAPQALEAFLTLSQSKQDEILAQFHSGPAEWSDSVTTPSLIPSRAIQKMVQDGIDHIRSLRSSLDISSAVKLLLILNMNGHAWGDRGVGLYPQGSLFNHSCSNNVRTRKRLDGDREWFAGQDVAMGDELNASYIAQSSAIALMGTPQRQNFLQQTKLFSCNCELCQAPISGLPCSNCRAVLVPRGGGHCTACQCVCSAEMASVLENGEDRVFGLVGENTINGLDDEYAMELLKKTRELYGPAHWTTLAISLCLLERESLTTDKELAQTLPLILAVRWGDRRACRVALMGLDRLMTMCVVPRTRRAALSVLENFVQCMESCVERDAFSEDQDIIFACHLTPLGRKALHYAANPDATAPCCIACALAHQQLEEQDALEIFKSSTEPPKTVRSSELRTINTGSTFEHQYR